MARPDVPPTTNKRVPPTAGKRVPPTAGKRASPADKRVSLAASDATGADRNAPRRFAILSGGLALVLLGALTWSLLDDPSPTVLPRPPAATPIATPAPTLEAAPALRPQAPAVAESVRIDPPRRLPRLTQLSLGALHSDGRLVPTALAPALGRRISVINVWATYCAPCMRELPRLLELLAGRSWGPDLRLVPILLEAPDRLNDLQRSALQTLRAAPASKQILVDLTPAGALQTVLHEAGLLPEQATLPITLVLDCEQRLRWLHRGEITDTQPLAAILDELRAELPRCVDPEPAAPDSCGDAYCDPERAEDCATCPADCGCPENRECVAVPGRRARCNFRTQGLKD